MAITVDNIAAGLYTAGGPRQIQQVLPTMEGAATWHSMWKIAGPPKAAAGANPPAYTVGSGYIPTRATAGAVGQANPTNSLFLAFLRARAAVVGTLILFDRVWACSGFATNTTSTQTVTTPGTLTAGRDPLSGLDVWPWIEIYTAPGATGATWTLTGTDSTGTTGRTWTYAHPANAETVGQTAPMLRGTAIGGCQVATSLACSVSSGTAGDVGVTLRRELGSVSVTNAYMDAVVDFAQVGLPEIFDDACLETVWLASATTTVTVFGRLGLSEMTP